MTSHDSVAKGFTFESVSAQLIDYYVILDEPIKGCKEANGSSGAFISGVRPGRPPSETQ